jgi:hypothetical protein
VNLTPGRTIKSNSNLHTEQTVKKKKNTKRKKKEGKTNKSKVLNKLEQAKTLPGPPEFLKLNIII